MKKFGLIQAYSLDEASKCAFDGAKVMAGGTDLIGTLKKDVFTEFPKTVVNIGHIEQMDHIDVGSESVRIGALTKLSAVASDPEIKETLPILAEVAHSVATPLVRNVGTVGGNLCQDVRCWFYRYPHEIGGRLDCLRKTGTQCYGIQGDNRYHSIFGGMKVGTPPCQSACPAATDIPGYMEEIRKGNWDKAAQIIMNHNPMPMLTSRICPHPCQDNCNQSEHGDCVNIHCMERTLGDYILEKADVYYAAPEAESGKRAAVIGAGPGGLTAAYYLRKEGHKVVVYDRMEKAGGVLRYGIPHYRLPKHYIDSYVDALANMGVEFKMNTEIGKDVTIEDLQSSYDTVYVGTGAWKAPILGLEGENLTQFGLNFLVEINTYLKGTVGDEVLVCGGGNVAMDVALTACRLGVRKVRLVCLEQEEEMPATSEEIARAKEEGVEILNGWGLDKVLTDSEGKVCGLQSKICTSVFDENGRFSPVYGDERRTIESDCIILATGQAVDISFLGSFADQMRTVRGLIDTDEETGETKKEGIYAGGDAVTGPNIAIRAVAAGRTAARSMHRSMGTGSVLAGKKDGFLTVDTCGIKETVSRKEEERPVGERTLTDEDAASLSREEASKEACRCMNCGCYSVNASDLSPVMVALGATIETTEKKIPAREFFTTKPDAKNMLNKGELVTGVEIPKVKAGCMHYDKFRLRDSVDFAVVSLASVFDVDGGTIRSASLVLGGVAPVPVCCDAAAEYLIGKPITEETAEKAAEIALEGAAPFEKNAYKVDVAKSYIKSAVLRAAD